MGPGADTQQRHQSDLLDGKYEGGKNLGHTVGMCS